MEISTEIQPTSFQFIEEVLSESRIELTPTLSWVMNNSLKLNYHISALKKYCIWKMHADRRILQTYMDIIIHIVLTLDGHDRRDINFLYKYIINLSIHK